MLEDFDASSSIFEDNGIIHNREVTSFAGSISWLVRTERIPRAVCLTDGDRLLVAKAGFRCFETSTTRKRKPALFEEVVRNFRSLGPMDDRANCSDLPTQKPDFSCRLRELVTF